MLEKYGIILVKIFFNNFLIGKVKAKLLFLVIFNLGGLLFMFVNKN